MAYTEIKQQNGRKYYYRARSMRAGKKFMKKRIYLGRNLMKKEIFAKEKEADKILNAAGKNKKQILLSGILPKILAVLKKYGIKRAGVFGSYARGEQNKN